MLISPLSQVGPDKVRGTIGDASFSAVKLCYHINDRAFDASKIVSKSLSHPSQSSPSM
jgi:hypothetical protein